jgi:glutathione S-transferase
MPSYGKSIHENGQQIMVQRSIALAVEPGVSHDKSRLLQEALNVTECKGNISIHKKLYLSDYSDYIMRTATIYIITEKGGGHLETTNLENIMLKSNGDFKPCDDDSFNPNFPSWKNTLPESVIKTFARYSCRYYNSSQDAYYMDQFCSNEGNLPATKFPKDGYIFMRSDEVNRTRRGEISADLCDSIVYDWDPIIENMVQAYLNMGWVKKTGGKETSSNVLNTTNSNISSLSSMTTTNIEIFIRTPSYYSTEETAAKVSSAIEKSFNALFSLIYSRHLRLLQDTIGIDHPVVASVELMSMNQVDCHKSYAETMNCYDIDGVVTISLNNRNATRLKIKITRNPPSLESAENIFFYKDLTSLQSTNLASMSKSSTVSIIIFSAAFGLLLLSGVICIFIYVYKRKSRQQVGRKLNKGDDREALTPPMSPKKEFDTENGTLSEDMLIKFDTHQSPIPEKCTDKLSLQKCWTEKNHQPKQNNISSQKCSPEVTTKKHPEEHSAEVAEDFKSFEVGKSHAIPGESHIVESCKKKKQKSKWAAALDESSGKKYYYNRVTKKSVWHRPTSFDGDDQDGSLPLFPKFDHDLGPLAVATKVHSIFKNKSAVSPQTSLVISLSQSQITETKPDLTIQPSSTSMTGFPWPSPTSSYESVSKTNSKVELLSKQEIVKTLLFNESSKQEEDEATWDRPSSNICDDRNVLISELPKVDHDLVSSDVKTMDEPNTPKNGMAINPSTSQIVSPSSDQQKKTKSFFTSKSSLTSLLYPSETRLTSSSESFIKKSTPLFYSLVQKNVNKLLPKEDNEHEEVDVIFWGMKLSADSSVIRAFLAFSGLTFKEKDVWGLTTTPEYTEKFPSSSSPAVECYGKCIYECVAIMKFLCRTYPQSCGSFYPESDLEKVTTIDWLCDYITMGILLQIPKAVHPTLGLVTGPGDVATMAMTKPYTKQAQEAASNYILHTLKRKYVGVFLKNTKYLLSNEPTIADYRFAPMINLIKVGCVIPERLQKYYDDMTRLPGFKKACQPVVNFSAAHWKKEEVKTFLLKSRSIHEEFEVIQETPAAIDCDGDEMDMFSVFSL